MKYFSGILLIVVVLLLVNCSKNPVTGRKQMTWLPESELIQMSNTQYSKFLESNPPIKGTSDYNTVQRVGNNIANAAQQYLNSKGLSSKLVGYDWVFNLVNVNEANAWCMPGGKVAVYSGIMPVAKDETGLAVVLSHEIAHAIAQHGNERMSQSMAAQMGGAAIAVASSGAKNPQTQDVFLQAYNVGSTLGVLKFSRKQETEADEMGLIFMAMAGYNPDNALEFWQRMKENNKGPKPQEWMSTHPSDEQRIKDIQKALPKARTFYTPRN